MADEAFIHIVRVDIDPEHEAAFNAWYEQTAFSGSAGLSRLAVRKALRLGRRGAEIRGHVRSRGAVGVRHAGVSEGEGFGPFEIPGEELHAHPAQADVGTGLREAMMMQPVVSKDPVGGIQER